MYLYVELWNTTERWRALSVEARTAFVDAIGPGMQSLLESGVNLLGFAANDSDTAHRSQHEYIAVWTMEDASHVDALEQAVAASGWYEWFDQVNARGVASPAPDILRAMIEER